MPGFQQGIRRYFPIVEILTTEDEVLSKSKQDIEKELHDYVDQVYSERELLFGDENLKTIEHSVPPPCSRSSLGRSPHTIGKYAPNPSVSRQSGNAIRSFSTARCRTRCSTK